MCQTIERKYSNTDSKDNWYYYDDLSRLVRNTDGTSNLEVYNIDELGNRDSITIAGVGTIDYDIDDSTNRYDQIDDNDLSYDHAGNLTTDHKGYSYEYDYENRIVEITKSGGQTTVAQYAYDALGRRIQKVDSIADKTTRYYHDNNWRVLTETDENNNKQRSYIYGNGIDEVLILTDANSNKYYYAQDHLGSTVCLIDETSDIVERYEYTPYGEVTIYTSDGGDGDWFDGDEITSINSAIGNPYLFTARDLDLLDSGNLKIQYNRNRYYYPQIARWLTKDPYGVVPNTEIPNFFNIIYQYQDGVNIYEYVRSNPIINNDSFGLVSYKLPLTGIEIEWEYKGKGCEKNGTLKVSKKGKYKFPPFLGSNVDAEYNISISGTSKFVNLSKEKCKNDYKFEPVFSKLTYNLWPLDDAYVKASLIKKAPDLEVDAGYKMLGFDKGFWNAGYKAYFDLEGSGTYRKVDKDCCCLERKVEINIMAQSKNNVTYAPAVAAVALGAAYALLLTEAYAIGAIKLIEEAIKKPQPAF